MNRTALISALQQSCSLYGYNSRSLGKQSLTAQSPPLPAALICEPTFQSIEGRHHGRIVYELKLYLLCSAIHLSPEQRSATVAKVENDALEILSLLSESEKVAFIENLQIEPIAQSVVGRAEVGVLAQCNITTIF